MDCILYFQCIGLFLPLDMEYTGSHLWKLQCLKACLFRKQLHHSYTVPFSPDSQLDDYTTTRAWCREDCNRKWMKNIKRERFNTREARWRQKMVWYKSYVLPANSRFCNNRMDPNSLGIVPSRLFADISSHVKFSSAPISFGIVPVIKLFFKWSICMSFMLANDSGKVPFSLLLNRSRSWSKHKINVSRSENSL
jgi:hypothetical protein